MADIFRNPLQVNRRDQPLGQALGAVLGEVVSRLPPPAPPPRPRVMPIAFEVYRDQDGNVVDLKATYGEVASATLASINPIKGSDGLTERIVPTYKG